MRELSTTPDRLDYSLPYIYADGYSIARIWLQRRSRLILGLPASPIAKELGPMLRLLRAETQKRLGTSVRAVGIALPDGALLSMNEINDALTYAGLQTIGAWETQTPDYEFNAAYGTNGFGLCSSYTNFFECEQEEDASGNGESVLHIDYTTHTLAINTDEYMAQARRRWKSPTTKFVDWKLGKDEIAPWPDEDAYWVALGTKVREAAVAKRRPFTQLLLTGDRAKDEKFLKVLKDALTNTDLASIVEVRNAQMDLTFVAARGAAMLQWRRQRGWLDCVQREFCSETTMLGYVKVRIGAYFDPWQ